MANHYYIMADNQELTRLALEHMVRQDAQCRLARASGRDALSALLRAGENAVVVLDYTLFDFTGEEQLLVMSERYQMTHWVLVSDELTPRFLRNVVYSSHRFSVVFKDSPLGDIRSALGAAASGGRFVCQRAMELILNQQQEEARPDVLTATEMSIVKAIARGKTTKEIADERFSSIHTITTHRKNIFRKLGVNTAHEVVRYALRSGWVDPAEFYI